MSKEVDEYRTLKTVADSEECLGWVAIRDEEVVGSRAMQACHLRHTECGLVELAVEDLGQDE
jgi:hypothetical protein